MRIHAERAHRVDQLAVVANGALAERFDVVAVGPTRLGPGKQRAVDLQELAGDLVALVMGQEDAVALVFDRIATGHHIDQQAPVGNPIEGRRHPRSNR